MDYRTLFLTYLASLTVYAAFTTLLALRNRKVYGLNWIAGSLLVGVAKYALQGLEGRLPTLISSLVVNELYLLSFVMQMLGLRWFVVRTPLRHRWSLVLVGALAALYAVLYHFKIPYIANLINIPVLIILGVTAWILLRNGRGLFYQPSRWAAAFLLGEVLVSTYRAVLTNLFYVKPWMVVKGQHDPHWLYSLMAMMFLTTCVFMSDLWFFFVELQVELVEQARTDALTGALNRRAFYLDADREVSRSIRTGKNLSVLVLDIDDFKSMNDTYGHAAGDHVLQQLVERIKSILRVQDLLARTGGEEFAILLPDTTYDLAKAVAERIRASLQTLDLTFDGTHCAISVSIGIAEMTPSIAVFEKVLQHADAAMYAAKRAGKNRIVAFEDAAQPNSTDLSSIAPSA